MFRDSLTCSFNSEWQALIDGAVCCVLCAVTV